MAFWNLAKLQLAEFRPGITSKAEMGDQLVMVYMEIAGAKEDTGHEHPFDQCGMVLKGKIEMFIEDERKTLGPDQCYFIPAGKRHGWKTSAGPVKILDVCAKQS